MVIKGKYNKARVCTDVIEGEAVEQIQALCDSKTFQGQKICIMPDVHAGAGCTIGTTMTITDKVVPQMVGVDIGCGMEVAELAERELNLKKLDEFIHANIPAGMSAREKAHAYAEQICLEDLLCQKKVGVKKRVFEPRYARWGKPLYRGGQGRRGKTLSCRAFGKPSLGA